jgi:dihydrofolate synthase/folylpolyglutamate synthase
MMKDKEHQTVITMLDQLADEFHFTQIDYKRAATAQELYDESHHPKKFVHESFAEAYELLKHPGKDEILVITGSLYFVSAIRPLMLEK